MAEFKTPDLSLTWIGNALAGLALAFGIDNILMNGTVTGSCLRHRRSRGFRRVRRRCGLWLKQAKKLN